MIFAFASSKGQTLPDSGFTNEAEAKNLWLNGKKEGKWCEYQKCDTVFVHVYWLKVYKDGIPYGIARKYHPEGYLLEITPYVNGKINGVVKSYYKGGKLQQECPYNNDLPNGIMKMYYESGKLESETPLNDSGINGIYKEYYENGKLKREAPNKYSRINGLEKCYYESGKLKSEIIYNNSVGVKVKYYDENGNEIK